MADQCQPTATQAESRYQKGRQSVCRQCFATCDNSASSGRYCLHHDENNKSMDDTPINPVTTLHIPKWNSQVINDLEYYNLEDDTDGGNSINFWTLDLLSESITNWILAEGPFALLNTHMDDEYDEYGLATGNQPSFV